MLRGHYGTSRKDRFPLSRCTTSPKRRSSPELLRVPLAVLKFPLPLFLSSKLTSGCLNERPDAADTGAGSGRRRPPQRSAPTDSTQPFLSFPRPRARVLTDLTCKALRGTQNNGTEQNRTEQARKRNRGNKGTNKQTNKQETCVLVCKLVCLPAASLAPFGDGNRCPFSLFFNCLLSFWLLRVLLLRGLSFGLSLRFTTKLKHARTHEHTPLSAPCPLSFRALSPSRRGSARGRQEKRREGSWPGSKFRARLPDGRSTRKVRLGLACLSSVYSYGAMHESLKEGRDRRRKMGKERPGQP